MEGLEGSFFLTALVAFFFLLTAAFFAAPVGNPFLFFVVVAAVAAAVPAWRLGLSLLAGAGADDGEGTMIVNNKKINKKMKINKKINKMRDAIRDRSLCCCYRIMTESRNLYFSHYSGIHKHWHENSIMEQNQ